MPPYKMQHGPYVSSSGSIAGIVDLNGSITGSIVSTQNLGITDVMAVNGNCCINVDDSINIPRYDKDIQELVDRVRELGNRCAEYESKMQALESEIEMLKSSNNKFFESPDGTESNTLESFFQDP